MIFELAQNVHEAVMAMPKEHLKHRILGLFEEAIRRDIHFIAHHPTTLFQCMWNTCWWLNDATSSSAFTPYATHRVVGMKHFLRA